MFGERLNFHKCRMTVLSMGREGECPDFINNIGKNFVDRSGHLIRLQRFDIKDNTV